MTSLIALATLRWLHHKLRYAWCSVASLADRPKQVAWCFGLALIVLVSGGCDVESGALAGGDSAAGTARVDLSNPYRIELTGTDHRWQMEYSGIPGLASQPKFLEVGSDLFVPLGTRILLVLKSTDYIYTLAVPDFGIKEIAVPRLEFEMDFLPSTLGNYQLIGDELCGGLRGDTPGRLVVEPIAAFQERLHRWSQPTSRGSSSHRNATH